MPLKKGYSKKTVSKNIAMEMKKHPEMPQKKAVAMSMNSARMSAMKAGKPGKAPVKKGGN